MTFSTNQKFLKALTLSVAITTSAIAQPTPNTKQSAISVDAARLIDVADYATKNIEELMALEEKKSIDLPYIENNKEDSKPVQPAEKSSLSKLRDTASSWVVSSLQFLGVPYVYGGTSPKGFDCSGFTSYVFKKAVGVLLPRTASEQANSSSFLSVSRVELKPGDLVFFNTMQRAFSHVGIYLGNNKFIHAPRTGSSVRVDSLNSTYWSTRFEVGKRVPGVDVKDIKLESTSKEQDYLIE